VCTASILIGVLGRAARRIQAALSARAPRSDAAAAAAAAPIIESRNEEPVADRLRERQKSPSQVTEIPGFEGLSLPECSLAAHCENGRKQEDRGLAVNGGSWPDAAGWVWMTDDSALRTGPDSERSLAFPDWGR